MKEVKRHAKKLVNCDQIFKWMLDNQQHLDKSLMALLLVFDQILKTDDSNTTHKIKVFLNVLNLFKWVKF
jgi:hypothetical protein